MKNLTLCDAWQTIHYLSPTESGSMHDRAAFRKALAELYPINLPAGSTLKQDLGFMGHAPSGVVIKRLRMLKDVIRIHDSCVRDCIRVVACGLHNLRVKAIDPTRLYQHSLRACAYDVKISK